MSSETREQIQARIDILKHQLLLKERDIELKKRELELKTSECERSFDSLSTQMQVVATVYENSRPDNKPIFEDMLNRIENCYLALQKFELMPETWSEITPDNWPSFQSTCFRFITSTRNVADKCEQLLYQMLLSEDTFAIASNMVNSPQSLTSIQNARTAWKMYFSRIKRLETRIEQCYDRVIERLLKVTGEWTQYELVPEQENSVSNLEKYDADATECNLESKRVLTMMQVSNALYHAGYLDSNKMYRGRIPFLIDALQVKFTITNAKGELFNAKTLRQMISNMKYKAPSYGKANRVITEIKEALGDL